MVYMLNCRLAEALEMDEGGGAADAGGALDSYYGDGGYVDEKMRQVQKFAMSVIVSSNCKTTQRRWHSSYSTRLISRQFKAPESEGPALCGTSKGLAETSQPTA